MSIPYSLFFCWAIFVGLLFDSPIGCASFGDCRMTSIATSRRALDPTAIAEADSLSGKAMHLDACHKSGGELMSV
jgi:hypothetical protein